jgi:transposase-like protein
MSTMSVAIRMRRCFPFTQRRHFEDGFQRDRRCELAVRRDRNGSFTPQLVPKGSRRLGRLDET